MLIHSPHLPGGSDPADPREAVEPAVKSEPDGPMFSPELSLTLMLITPFVVIFTGSMVIYCAGYLLGILTIFQACDGAARSPVGRAWHVWIAVHALAFMVCGALIAAISHNDRVSFAALALILAWPVIWAVHRIAVQPRPRRITGTPD